MWKNSWEGPKIELEMGGGSSSQRQELNWEQNWERIQGDPERFRTRVTSEREDSAGFQPKIGSKEADSARFQPKIGSKGADLALF